MITLEENKVKLDPEIINEAEKHIGSAKIIRFLKRFKFTKEEAMHLIEIHALKKKFKEVN